MSRILLLSYYFPPIGGAGAQRPVKFARYLHDLGHEVVVLTGSGRTGALWTPADPSLQIDLPAGVQVVRVQGAEPGPPTGVRGRIGRILQRQNEWSRWWRTGVLESAESIGQVDVIHTIMSPFASAEPSNTLASRLGIGWIADLGDPWALDEMMVYPSALHRRLEIRRMRHMLGTSAAIVMSTPEAARQVIDEFPELRDRPVIAIPNGYDPADFAGISVARRTGEKFRVVHTGYLHTSAGLRQRDQSRFRRALGGGSPGVDILPRSHFYLVEAIKTMLLRDPTLRDRLELHFAGVLSDTDRHVAEQVPVTILHGYLPHAESIALMQSADLLFLPMQRLPKGRRSTTVPGKTYEYLASGRPMLGAVPPGDARDILERSGRAILCEPGDVEGLVAALTKALSEAGDSHTADASAEAFSYSALAGQVGSLIDALVRPVKAGGRRDRMHPPEAA